VDTPLRLGLGHALHTVPAGLELELRVRALPGDPQDDLLVSAKLGLRFRNDLDLPPVALGVAALRGKAPAKSAD
jgi:hypothetical protein